MFTGLYASIPPTSNVYEPANVIFFFRFPTIQPKDVPVIIGTETELLPVINLPDTNEREFERVMSLFRYTLELLLTMRVSINADPLTVIYCGDDPLKVTLKPF